jgi:hypothetical protein
LKKYYIKDITTKEIYNKAFTLLRKAARPYAAKYKLECRPINNSPTSSKTSFLDTHTSTNSSRV